VGGYGFHQLLKALTKLKDHASRSPPSGQAEGVPLTAVLPAPPSVPCGQPLDSQPLDALLFLRFLEAGLCVYLKILSIPTKHKDLFLLHSSQIL